MRFVISLLIGAGLMAPAYGQVVRLTHEQMVKYTSKNPFDRFPDGRPKVPDALLERMKGVSLEEAYGILLNRGYRHQYAGTEFQILHPGQKLVGRAYTAQYLPMRPDLQETLDADAKAEGLPSGTNQKIIDYLQANDVPVIDIGGAAPGHNFGGSNLQAAVFGVTHTGSVIDGDIRDLDGILKFPTQIYFRKAHPAAVAEVTVVSINIPIRLGDAVVLPGDVVLGDDEGVLFIPPHLVKAIVDAADLIHIHDDWTIDKFLTGKYKASQLYGGPGLSPELQKEYDEYVKKRLAELNK